MRRSASVGVVERGEITVQQNFGGDDDTAFIIGSASKSFTALAIMQLVEAGKLALNDTIVSHIRDFTTRDSDQSDSITIRHLLTHRGGIPTAITLQYLTGEMPETFDERIANLAGIELTSASGSEFAYANENYATLGKLVEVTSGQSFGSYIEEHIFTPLGMEGSSAHVTAIDAGHVNLFGAKVAQDEHYTEGFIADGYMTSTLSDMLHYVQFQLGDGTVDGRQVPSADGLTLLHTGQVSVQTASPLKDPDAPEGLRRIKVGRYGVSGGRRV